MDAEMAGRMKRKRTVYGEVDLSKLKTIPIAERMQGWSAHATSVGKANPTTAPRMFHGEFRALARQEHYMLTGEDDG
jgi:hypothetical protein